MRIITGVFFGLAGLFALAAVADEQSADASKKTLDDAGLRAAFAGKTHIGLYRRYLEAYGEQRFIETYTDNGNLQYTAGTLSISGTWTISAGKICFQYNSPEFLAGCFRVVADQGCYYSYEIFPSGRQAIPGRDPWWIRSHIDGTDPACAGPDLVS
ncbi:MAG: hypothetical protein AAFR29_04805 [Pseudomonadota bacterium]